MTAKYLTTCLAFLLVVIASAADAQDAAALRARYGALREQLSNNNFRRPLYLQSSETSSESKGDIYAVLQQPYSVTGHALRGADHWCEILILHLNVKNCDAVTGDTMSVAIGKKHDEPLEDTHRVDFNYSLPHASADYVQVLLRAATGPLGTKNYRITLEAVQLDERQTFVHLSYSYSYGLAARMAMQAYLATVGRKKIGFSVVGTRSDGEPIYVDGVRGAVERNTMRYYLAIEAYVGALSAPAPEQLEKRLRDWYEATEKFAAQLHELDRTEYLEMKRREVARQQSAIRRAASR